MSRTALNVLQMLRSLVKKMLRYFTQQNETFILLIAVDEKSETSK